MRAGQHGAAVTFEGTLVWMKAERPDAGQGDQAG
jgi:hypothetical protein